MPAKVRWRTPRNSTLKSIWKHFFDICFTGRGVSGRLPSNLKQFESPSLESSQSRGFGLTYFVFNNICIHVSDDSDEIFTGAPAGD